MSEDAVDIEIDPADEEEAAPEEGDAEGEESPGDSDALVERVAAHDEALAAEVEALRDRASELEADLESTEDDLATVEDDLAAAEERVEDLESKLKRTRADFQNYKKRSKKRQEELEARATEDLVERLVPVRDNLLRALEQDENADIRDGVESTLEEFDRVLAEENVEAIEPAPGDEVDPERHQVMMRVDSDQPAETIAEVYRVGYEMAERVIQEAQVTVSDGEK
ncbi:MAG: nucleotide exchange factor GrpE [Haloferacaceae archaeon]